MGATEPVTITLSLISHTNVGKTTLARTLLRREIGRVADREHVTEISESFTLIETPTARLTLWDTPGFGNLVPLMRRLRAEHNPVGWLLHHVWDRLLDRPMYCSQQAARNVRDEADVVLYLVNAAEDPEHAGYVDPELELLGWMARPVLVLLNQVGDEDEQRLLPRWRALADRHAVIRDVLPLDAFSRCWIHESLALERVVSVLPADRQPAMSELARAWDERNRAAFDAAAGCIGRYLVTTASDREADAGGTVRELFRTNVERLGLPAPPAGNAMRVLSDRLDRRTTELSGALVELYGLERESELAIQKDLDDTQRRGSSLGDGSGALIGAVLGAIPTGLVADLSTGGLSLGGGMIAGGILGALGGSALARGYRWVSGAEPAVHWTSPFLARLTQQSLLRYLAVAHWGRGRGPFAERALAEHWMGRVDHAMRREREGLDRCWDEAVEAAGDDDALMRVEQRATRTIGDILRHALIDAYPEARGRI